MKVLEKGRKQKGWSVEQRCTGHGNGEGGCNALLLVEAADLYQTTSGHYDGSTDRYVTFSCPECNVCTDLTKELVSMIPYHTRNEISNRSADSLHGPRFDR